MRTYLSKRVKSSVKEVGYLTNAYLNSSIKSATKWSEGGGDVDKFLEWHDNDNNYRKYLEVYDDIYGIFDDVLGENQSENVGEAFQRLSKKDQERIMKLIESTGYDIKSATEWSEGSGDVSDTFLDPQGMFGEPGSTVTFNELKAYWDENQNSDPILSEYGDFNSWYNETIQWFQPIGELLDSGV